MTIDGFTIVDDLMPINNGGRTADYAQMSISQQGDNTFLYAGNIYSGNSLTSILSFLIEKDSFDLAVSKLISPISSQSLADQKVISFDLISFKNLFSGDYSVYVKSCR